jgi:hypothetical protein
MYQRHTPRSIIPHQYAGDIMEFPVLTVYRDASMAQVAHLLRYAVIAL